LAVTASSRRGINEPIGDSDQAARQGEGALEVMRARPHHAAVAPDRRCLIATSRQGYCFMTDADAADNSGRCVLQVRQQVNSVLESLRYYLV